MKKLLLASFILFAPIGFPPRLGMQLEASKHSKYQKISDEKLAREMIDCLVLIYHDLEDLHKDIALLEQEIASIRQELNDM